jgi:hypothetical protein
MENKKLDKGLMLPTDYTEEDILICISDYHIRTGKNQPVKIYIPKDQKEAVNWLTDFGIQVLTSGIQEGTILLV